MIGKVWQKSLKDCKENYKAILLILLVSGLLLSFVLKLSLKHDVEIKYLTGDVASLFDAAPYAGFLSQLGFLLWGTSAGICFFQAASLNRNTDKKEIRNFFLFSGIISMILVFDDMFMFHEDIFPSLGIHQGVVYGVYLILIAYYLIRFNKRILNTNFIFIGLAFAFFGISMGLDSLHIGGIDPYFFEDGAKFLGILFWLYYFLNTGLKYSEAMLRDK